jgi:hypothetical protein
MWNKEILEQCGCWFTDTGECVKDDINLNKFARVIIEKERQVVAEWIMNKGFATGHGDTIVDMLDELEWQIAEREREACAKIAEWHKQMAFDIRARGQE